MRHELKLEYNFIQSLVILFDINIECDYAKRLISPQYLECE